MHISKHEGRYRLLAIVATLFVAAESSAQPAARVVERALETMTGTSTGTVPWLWFEASGTRNQGAEHQGRSPESLDPTGFRETMALSQEGSRLAYWSRHDRYDGTKEWLGNIYIGDRRTIIVRQQGFAIELQSEDLIAERERLSRRLPHMLLAEVLRDGAELRVAARGDAETVVVATLVGHEITLVLKDGLLTRAEYSTDVQSFGDADIAWIYDDYTRVDGYGLFPLGYQLLVQNRPFLEMKVEAVGTDEASGRKLFELPEGVEPPELRRIPAGRDPAASAEVVEVAEGVYVVRNLRFGFHPMFVELDDSIVAFDAPAGYRLLEQLPAGDVAPGPSSAWLSERYLELIEKTVPDKPVRHVVLTHFHNDHAGGVRAFIAAGATVWTSASTRGAVLGLAQAPHTLAPDAFAVEPRAARVEVVTERQSLGDSRRRIEVLEIGPNPHSDAMLVVHLPDDEIVFASDIIEPTDVADFPSPDFALVDRFFVAWLDGAGLAPERVFSMHAIDVATPAHLERARETADSAR